jgi:hypothetical protein
MRQKSRRQDRQLSSEDDEPREQIYVCVEQSDTRSRQRRVIRRASCGDRALAVIEAWYVRAVD